MVPRFLQTLLGAIAFYTAIPLPTSWPFQFQGVARWAPVIGIGIGSAIGGVDWLLAGIPLGPLLKSALLVLLWLVITGGLHFDGAMDMADGWAVLDPKRRLEVMSDSRSGAFGVMSAIAILLLKTLALGEIQSHRLWALMMAAGWGRWGQLWAIAQYPYLKANGKGAFHKTTVRSGWEALPTACLLFGVAIAHWGPLEGMTMGLWGLVLAMSLGSLIQKKFGGHTGDTYGGIVEWTETLLLVVLSGFF